MTLHHKTKQQTHFISQNQITNAFYITKPNNKHTLYYITKRNNKHTWHYITKPNNKHIWHNITATNTHITSQNQITNALDITSHHITNTQNVLLHRLALRPHRGARAPLVSLHCEEQRLFRAQPWVPVPACRCPAWCAEEWGRSWTGCRCRGLAVSPAGLGSWCRLDPGPGSLPSLHDTHPATVI